MGNRNITTTLSAIILALFALLTIFLSSSIIFDWFDIRQKQGDFILFIVWANFIASIVYFIAVYGFIKRKKWTFWILLSALLVLVIAFIFLQYYIHYGGIYKSQTVMAMLFRMAVTSLFALIAYFKLIREKHI